MEEVVDGVGVDAGQVSGVASAEISGIAPRPAVAAVNERLETNNNNTTIFTHHHHHHHL